MALKPHALRALQENEHISTRIWVLFLCSGASKTRDHPWQLSRTGRLTMHICIRRPGSPDTHGRGLEVGKMLHRAKWPCFWVGDLGAMMVVCAHKGLARRTHQLRHQLHTSKLFSLSHTFFFGANPLSAVYLKPCTFLHVTRSISLVCRPSCLRRMPRGFLRIPTRSSQDPCGFRACAAITSGVRGGHSRITRF